MFAILFEGLLINIEEEIHHFAVLGGGGVKGHQNCKQNFCVGTNNANVRGVPGLLLLSVLLLLQFLLLLVLLHSLPLEVCSFCESSKPARNCTAAFE